MVTFLNIGMRADYLPQWMRSLGVGFFAVTLARIVTERPVAGIEKAG